MKMYLYSLLAMAVFACLLSGCSAPARYQITGGGSGAYRLDTQTGDVRYYTPKGWLPADAPLPSLAGQ